MAVRACQSRWAKLLCKQVWQQNERLVLQIIDPYDCRLEVLALYFCMISSKKVKQHAISAPASESTNLTFRDQMHANCPPHDKSIFKKSYVYRMQHWGDVACDLRTPLCPPHTPRARCFFCWERPQLCHAYAVVHELAAHCSLRIQSKL
jgi:hypothetical protein